MRRSSWSWAGMVLPRVHRGVNRRNEGVRRIRELARPDGRSAITGFIIDRICTSSVHRNRAQAHCARVVTV